MWRASETPVIVNDDFTNRLLFEHDLFGKPVPTFPDHALGRPHQLQRRRQPEAALAGKRNGFQFRALRVTGAGKTDANLVAAEYRILALGRGVLLIDDFALPAAARRTVGAEIVEKGIAAEDAAVDQQHHAGQAAIDAVE